MYLHIYRNGIFEYQNLLKVKTGSVTFVTTILASGHEAQKAPSPLLLKT